MKQTENAAYQQGKKEEAKRDADGKGDAGEGGAERGEEGGEREKTASGSGQTDTAGSGAQGPPGGQ